MDLFLINLKYTLYMILLFQVQALFVFPKYSLMEFTGTRKLDEFYLAFFSTPNPKKIRKLKLNQVQF